MVRNGEHFEMFAVNIVQFLYIYIYIFFFTSDSNFTDVTTKLVSDCGTREMSIEYVDFL